jgi:DNA-binding NarL/FixJ family response regulator
VVLVGGVLPGLEGLETAKRIKSLPDAPVVVVTSFADSEPVRREAWMSGADAFVAKTDLAEQLPSLLAQAARGERPCPPHPPRSRFRPPESETSG